MSLRNRIAILVGGTVLLASLIGGIGIAFSASGVGVDRVDRELRADGDRIRPLVSGLGDRLRPTLQARRSICESTDSITGESESDSPESAETSEPSAHDEPPSDHEPNASEGSRTRRPNHHIGSRLSPEFEASIQIIRASGEVLPGCLPLPVDEADIELAQPTTPRDGVRLRTVTIDDERYRVLTMHTGETGSIQLARSLELTEGTVRAIFTRTALFGALGALLAGLVGWAFARRATKPVERLSATAERVATTRDLGERIEVEGNDEIADLASAFNTMLGSLDTMREQQHRLVQDASHELRTPLTSIRTNIDLLRRRPDVAVELRARMLDDISAELEELTELTAELVDSATELRTDPAQSIEFELESVVESCLDRARRRHSREFALTSGQPANVVGDPDLLARAVTNLLNNAAKFSDPESGTIEALVDGASVRVLDRGPGISPTDLAHVFDRFYRATSARSAPGSGLGLSIVKQIVEAHGGTVDVANRPTGGLDIGFSLPQNPPT